MNDKDLAWHIEQACFSAWPALREEVFGGWCLRFSEGLTRRANSANPLQGEREDSEDFIAACEDRYKAEGLPTIFRLPSLIDPAINNRLKDLGYQSESASLALHADLSRFGTVADPNITFELRPSHEWFEAMIRMQHYNEQKAAIYRRIVSSITAPAVFAVARVDGQISSLAFGAIYRNLLCIESVITDGAFRGRGLAKHMLSSLISHARPDIAGVCLQVQADNQAAIKLYDNLGFKELYSYHYQCKPYGAHHR